MQSEADVSTPANPPPPFGDPSLKIIPVLPVLNDKLKGKFAPNKLGAVAADPPEHKEDPVISPRFRGRAPSPRQHEDISDLPKVEPVVLVQAAIRRYHAMTERKRRQRMTIFRTKVANETYTTEQAYVHSLKVMLGLYVHPLQVAIGTPNEIVTLNDFNLLFPTVEVIIRLNSEFLLYLQERIDNWSPQQKVGDVFLKMTPFFKLYTDYCRSYDTSVATLKRLQQENEAFRTYLKTTNSIREVNEGLDLISFLIKPIQRIPRYVLLCEQLLKYTWQEHRDWADTEKALLQLQNVANHVNEAMRDAQRMNQLLKVEQQFGYTLNLMHPARKFIKQGQLGKVTSRIIVNPTYFLFSDILVYGYVSSQGYKCKGTIPMGTTWIRDLQDTEALKNAFQIVSRKKTYTVFADSAATKREWMVALNEVIDKLVTIDPSLISKRNLTIKTTERGAKFFWNLFTYDKTQIDPTNAKDMEKQIEQRQRDDLLSVQQRSKSFIPLKPGDNASPPPEDDIYFFDAFASRQRPSLSSISPRTPVHRVDNEDAKVPLLRDVRATGGHSINVDDQDSSSESSACGCCTIL